MGCRDAGRAAFHIGRRVDGQRSVTLTVLSAEQALNSIQGESYIRDTRARHSTHTPAKQRAV